MLFYILIYILIGLFVLAIAQGIMIRVQGDVNEDKTLELKAQELTEYLDTGHARAFDGQGSNLLMLAAAEDGAVMIPVIEKALAYGIDVNARSKRRGNTALHYACCQRYRIDIVSLLISRSGDPNIVNEDNVTPFWNACIVGNSGVVEMLLPRMRDLNMSEKNQGYTPLMAAAREGQIQVVHKLLDFGVNAKLLSKAGESAYDIAKANLPRHYTHNPNSASSDESYARHNHGLNEMARRLDCAQRDIVFKPRKYKSTASFSGIEPDMDE